MIDGFWILEDLRNIWLQRNNIRALLVGSIMLSTDTT